MLVIAIEGVSGIGKTTLLIQKSAKFRVLFKNISNIDIGSYKVIKLSKIYGKETIRVLKGSNEDRAIKFLKLFQERIDQVADILTYYNFQYSQNKAIIFDRIGLQSLYLALLYAGWIHDRHYAVRRIKKIYNECFNRSICDDIRKLFGYMDYLFILSYAEGKEKLKQRLMQNENFMLKHKDIRWDFFDELYDMYVNTRYILTQYFELTPMNGNKIYIISVSHDYDSYGLVV